MPSRDPPSPARAFTLETRAPFRLDLTVSVLQRLPGHPVEVWADDAYVRAFETPAGPVAWVVRARGGVARLAAELHGPAGAEGPWRARLRRALGLDVDLAPFHAAARAVPALAAASRRIEGVRPPRFSSLHEGFLSVIPFQQVSLAAAVATLGRVVAALAEPVRVGGLVVRPFPPAGRIADAPERLLRGCGLSAAKAQAIRGAAWAVASGALSEETLDGLPSEALVERLREVPGIGPWSANLLALRAFGRLDVFPPGDAAAVKVLAELGGAARLLERLAPWKGMLYYGLLLDRRLARVELAAPRSP